MQLERWHFYYYTYSNPIQTLLSGSRLIWLW
jgi:hypothetical protein